jgi:TolA-binding protein
MKTALLVLSVVALMAMPEVSAGCVWPQEQIRSEAFASLEQVNKKAVSSFDAEIAKIDQQLRDTEDRIAKLEQVIAPVWEWVEIKKTTTDFSSLSCG